MPTCGDAPLENPDIQPFFGRTQLNNFGGNLEVHFYQLATDQYSRRAIGISRVYLLEPLRSTSESDPGNCQHSASSAPTVQEGTQAQVSPLGRAHYAPRLVTSALRKGCSKHHGDRTVVRENHDDVLSVPFKCPLAALVTIQLLGRVFQINKWTGSRLPECSPYREFAKVTLLTPS